MLCPNGACRDELAISNAINGQPVQFCKWKHPTQKFDLAGFLRTERQRNQFGPNDFVEACKQPHPDQCRLLFAVGRMEYPQHRVALKIVPTDENIFSGHRHAVQSVNSRARKVITKAVVCNVSGPDEQVGDDILDIVELEFDAIRTVTFSSQSFPITEEDTASGVQDVIFGICGYLAVFVCKVHVSSFADRDFWMYHSRTNGMGCPETCTNHASSKKP